MNEHLLSLEPAPVWAYFKEILEIPRPSKKEEKIIRYLLDFGKKQQLETLQDEVGNVLIRKPATPGMEHKKTVVLQSHIDMVCEKNSDKQHDFENDPIDTHIKDGWVYANGTTLGADDGIGVAAQLAILASDNIPHGPLECLFTVDEETGLTGAFGLKPGFLKSEILLNLDSEDEGQLFIGCAGGQDTQAWLPFDKEPVPEGYTAYKVMVSGLKGGHSGDEINKGHANANKILNRFLWESREELGLKLSLFDGGNLRNAIAREAYAIVLLPEDMEPDLIMFVQNYQEIFRSEYPVTEPDLAFTFSKAEMPDFIIDEDSTFQLLNALYACPHGVIAMSQEIDNFVETSTNLASVKFEEDEILITTSQRSSVDTEKVDVTNMVTSVFNLAGARTETSDGYPGWTPNPNSAIVEITERSYKKLFQTEPEVLAIHAGLECGLIGDKYPGMDMISFGPTIKGAHSPDERIEIESVQKFWDLTLDVLKNIPE
ncbi:MAG: cytosol nonspecific dipeptidase [Bacteroidetes bacterium]|nr:MAG: cytosol nonspecific dipeptidase [Bacteroidota bacterium]